MRHQMGIYSQVMSVLIDFFNRASVIIESGMTSTGALHKAVIALNLEN